MLCQGRGRPRKHISSCVATLTSIQKVPLQRIGNVLRRKQLKLQRQRIFKLATTNVYSKVTRHNFSSIRDLKKFARQLGKNTICQVHNLWQKKAIGNFEDYTSSSKYKNDHTYWKNIELRDLTPNTVIFENILKNKDDKFPIDVHVDQWIGIEVHLFGRKRLIGEVGSTTSNVYEKLRSIVVNPKGEGVCASFIKKKDEEEDRKFLFEQNYGIFPSWVSCRRSITRINSCSGISNDHIATLLASLPKIENCQDDHATIQSNIPCPKEMDLLAHASERVYLVNQSSTIIPMEESFTSHSSIVNLHKDSSLDFHQKKQDNISILYKDTIQVCPTTPEKAQKRRRNYQDIIPNYKVNANISKQFTSKLPFGAHKERSNCTLDNPLTYNEIIKENENLFNQEKSFPQSTCGLKQSVISEGMRDIGLIKHTNDLFTLASNDKMISNLFIERQKQVEALSIELSNKVLALLDFPFVEQSHLLYNSSVEELVERSTCNVSQCFEEIALSNEYSPQISENNISSLSDEWTTYHVGSAEMTALNTFNEEEMQFDTSFKEQQSIAQKDIYFQNLNRERNEHFTSNNVDSQIKGSKSIENNCSVTNNFLYRIDELENGRFMQPYPSPHRVQKSSISPILPTESIEERTMSSFYASTSNKVNDIMLNRLKKMIEKNYCKDVLETKNMEQDLNYVDVSFDHGQINASNLYFDQKSTKKCKGIGLLGDNCFEEEDLMKVRDTIIIQMRSQFQNQNQNSTSPIEMNDVLSEQNLQDLINMKDNVFDQMYSHFEVPNLDSTLSNENDVMLVEDNCKAEDLMKMRKINHLQMHSQSTNPNPNPSSCLESTIVIEQNNLNVNKNSINNNGQVGFQCQDTNPTPNFVKELTTMLCAMANDKDFREKSHNMLPTNNETLHLTSSPLHDSCFEEKATHFKMFIQFIEYIKTLLGNTSLENSPLKLSFNIQNHDEWKEEKIDFERLLSIILHSINSEQLQIMMNLLEINISSIMELNQCQEVKRQYEDENQLSTEVIECQQEFKEKDEGANKESNLEVTKNEQIIESNNDNAKEDKKPLSDLDPTKKKKHFQISVDSSSIIEKVNHMTDIVPFVGNAIVSYNDSFLTLQKRKPRPKVNLDIETIKVWKLLMGKTDPTDNDAYNLDNELKWKDERLVMQEQANNFIRRMHLIQGDRSFSRWKGSIVDSIIGVFLTQNVSDVLSSSAYMSLRSRFPLNQGSIRSESLESESQRLFQSDDIEIDLEYFQTLQEAQTSSFFNVLTNYTLPSLANKGLEDVINPQGCCNEENNRRNLERRQVDTLFFPWNKSPSSTSKQNKSVSYLQFEQTPILKNTSMNVFKESLELNVNANEISSAFDAETAGKNIAFLQSGDENEEPLMSLNIEQGKNGAELNAHCIFTQSKCKNFTKEITESNLKSQLAFSPNIHLQKDELIGLDRARLEAQQVCARKSCKWNALAEKYNAKCQQAALDTATTLPCSNIVEDGVDWEAVRCANLEEIADAIKERGMNWKLAGRIKGFLERLRLEQGSINLEWLRSIPSDDAKEFLSSIHGLGLKSVECIRLLTLHHLAFPVDTNVGRICVRLGWVPLEPLPEEVQLHVLELYPVQATIQKYLWPRLCTLDQQTLYELHYQLITFGKVFCTKSKPNCNACPMRSDCKHFASALASAKLALPPSERDSLSKGGPLTLSFGSSTLTKEEAFWSTSKPMQPSMNISEYCQPIIEEPMTPESEANMSEFDIEDYPYYIEEISPKKMMELINQGIHKQQVETHNCCQFDISTTFSKPEIMMVDPKEIPFEVPSQSITKSSQMVDFEEPMIVDGENLEKDCITTIKVNTLLNDTSSKEVVMLPAGIASLPVPKLKNIERLRTIHYVYELPDNHPLLEGMDAREVDDPCFYLLAIWSPGEVPESIPNINDNNEEISFNLSNDEENIKATLLIPCRTAMKGSFPLNGTYFQVNEVFADHESSLQPILVPRILLWNLCRRFVYFGTSITSILRGMTTEEIQACFWQGYICVRGFDRITCAPKPLVHRLHFQTTKSIMKSTTMKNTKT